MNDFIAVDAMGGDNAPAAIIEGCVAFLKNNDARICLLGDIEKINAFGGAVLDDPRITVVHAPEIIGFDEVPTAAVRQKKNSSIVVGMNLLKKGLTIGEKTEKVGAFVSAGSTGALLTAATLLVGRAKGVERPALATLLPCEKKSDGDLGYVFVMDVGANAECKPSYLCQFGKMGSVYMENILGVKNPRIGLVNIGAEKEKGNTLTKEAYELLENSDINFMGNTEACDIPRGTVDVAICDGFVGNVILKFAEGFSKSLLSTIKKTLMSNFSGKIGGLFAGSSFKKLKTMFDPSEIGGAPFLGLNALVVKAHGGSNARAIESALKQCSLFIEKDIVKKIEENL